MALHNCKQEERINRLECQEAVMGVEIKNLISKLDDLTSWIKALVITIIPVILTSIGYLLIKLIGK